MQWYTKDYVLTHVAQASPYLNNLSKTYTDIYLKYPNRQHAEHNSYSFNNRIFNQSLLAKTSQNTKHNIILKYIMFKKYLKTQNREFITKTK